MVSFESILMRVHGNVWDHAILVPKAEGDKLKFAEAKRVLCTINKEITIHAALMPVGDGNYFINTNKEVRKKLSLNLGDTVQVELEVDTSKYGMALPSELEAAWEIDPEGHEVFHTLTMGKQRSLIHIIGKPKSSELRIHKSLVVLEYLKSVNGQLDFKELNLAFKNSKHR